jgi:argininosuccinate lyase
LVEKGVAFRDAHEVVATAVRVANSKNLGLEDISLIELQQFSALIDEDVYQILTPEGSVALRNHIGGTSPEQVKAAVARAEIHLKD